MKIRAAYILGFVRIAVCALSIAFVSFSHSSSLNTKDNHVGTDQADKYGEIHGIVVDSTTLSLCYVPLLRLKLESKEYSCVDSIAAGKFTVVVPEGTYNVTVDFGWFMTKTMRRIEVSSSDNDSLLVFMFDAWTGAPDYLK